MLHMGLRLGGVMTAINQWVGEIITDAVFIVARNATYSVNEYASIDLQMKISIDNRPAPMGVTINLIDNSNFFGIPEPKKTCSFWTVWGDAGSTFKNSPQFDGLNDANKTYGWETGHVFAVAGSYTATSYCVDWRTGQKGKVTHTFTVNDDGDVVYSGSNTIYLDTSGIFPNSQSGWQEYTGWSSVVAALNSAKHDTRLLIETGSDVVATSLLSLYNYCQIGAIGNGERPKIRVKNSGISSFTGDVLFYNDKNRGTGIGTILWGFDIVGNYDPVEGVGETRNTTAIYLWGTQKLTLWDLNGSGIGIFAYPRHGDTRVEDILIADCNVTDWSSLPIFGSLDNSVIIGNDIRQNENAQSGPGAKDVYRNVIPGDDSTLTHTLTDVAIFGDVDKNLKVFSRDNSTDTYTPLTKDNDFTFIEGTDPTSPSANNGTHQITLNTFIPSTSTLIAHSKYYASHGPIRLEQAKGVYITNNWLKPKTGWSFWDLVNQIYAVQSCVRWGSDGAEGDTGGIAYNLLEGGADIITTSPANSGIRQHPSGVLVIEKNYMKGYDATENAVRIGKTNLVIRTNYMIQEDMASIDAGHEFVAFAYVEKNGETLDDVDADAIDVYNNTTINLMSTENGARDTFDVVENSSSFTNVNKGNNLIYHLDNTVTLPDYWPLDPDNFYRPEEGSAAIDGGTPTNLVWDDLAGNLVGETASIGAFDSARDKILTMNGSSWITLSGINLISGDVVLLDMNIIGSAYTGFMQNFDLRRDPVKWFIPADKIINLTFGGNARANNSSIVSDIGPEVRRLQFECVASVALTLIGARNAGNGQDSAPSGTIFKNLMIYREGNLIHHIPFNSGSTTTENDLVGSAVATYIGVTGADWD